MTTERAVTGYTQTDYTLDILPDPIFGQDVLVTTNNQLPGYESWTYNWEFPTKWSNLRRYFEEIPNFNAGEVIDYLEQNNQSLEDHLDTAFLKTSGGIIQGVLQVDGDFSAGIGATGGYNHYIQGDTTTIVTDNFNGFVIRDESSIGAGGVAIAWMSGLFDFGYVFAVDPNGSAIINSYSTQLVRFRQNGTTRAYIDASGHFVTVNNHEVQGILWIENSASTISSTTTVDARGWNISATSVYRQAGPGLVWALNCTTTGTASTNIMVLRRRGTDCGVVSVTGNTATWGTTSDYRRKNELGPIGNALSQLKTLRPIEFEWKESKDPYNSQGFMAHEVQKVVPQAVAGEKDAVDEEGNPVYQMVDYGKLVPLLVASIQELEAKVAQLEASLG